MKKTITLAACALFAMSSVVVAQEAKKEAAPAKKEEAKKEAAPAKKEKAKKEAAPAKKEESKKEDTKK
jgi:hypothetical protein